MDCFLIVAFQDCSLGKTLNLTGVEGIFDNCGIAGNIELDALATEPIIFKDCISAVAGSSKPILDVNGTAAGINFRRYTGGLDIRNFNNVAGTMSLDLNGSEVRLDSVTNTAGEIVARGVGRIIDENNNITVRGTSMEWYNYKELIILKLQNVKNIYKIDLRYKLQYLRQTENLKF